MIQFMICLYNREDAGAKAAVRPVPPPAEGGFWGSGSGELRACLGSPISLWGRVHGPCLPAYLRGWDIALAFGGHVTTGNWVKVDLGRCSAFFNEI